MVVETSFLELLTSVEAPCKELRIWAGVRTAEIIFICAARSSKGARNEEKCMVTTVGDFVSVLKRARCYPRIGKRDGDRWPDDMSPRGIGGDLYFDLAKT